MTRNNDKPYEYQDKVRDLYLNKGHDIILQAPTGAGKTRAAIEPGIWGFHYDRPRGKPKRSKYNYPARIIYAAPMRVLGNQFIKDHKKLADDPRLRWEDVWSPSIQTGERPEDKQFEHKLIAATVDQVLASFLNVPYGLPKRLDNINAGAMIGSYLVFDEFHLYPRKQMMLTTLAMLKMLKGISRFVLMSATFSTRFLKIIADELGVPDEALITHDPDIPLADSIFGDVPSLQTQERIWSTAPDDIPLSAGAVRAHMGDAKRVLCICNTVHRAQEVFRDLREYDDIDLLLLHSRFLKNDRAAIENRLRDALGKEAPEPDRPFVLVATQTVEVGLDISSDLLLTECAPAASLIQRAGRCARRENESGRVIVFQPRDDDGEIIYAPYIDDGFEEVCHRTWDVLNTPEFNGEKMDFQREQALIDATHGDHDAAFIEGMRQKIEGRIEATTDCMRTRHSGLLPQLIRKQTSVPLYIHADPMRDDLLIEKPWRREAFSVSKGLLYRYMKEHGDESGPDFLLQSGHDKTVDGGEGWRKSIYEWEGILNEDEIYEDRWRFVAHPEAVQYDAEVGLVMAPVDPNNLPTLEESPKKPRESWDYALYRAERYHEHIAGLYWAFTRPVTIEDTHRLALRNEFIYPLGRLCAALNLDPADGERLMRIVLALHDVGKLNRPWQDWARAYQRDFVAEGFAPTIALDDPLPLAHTDHDRANDIHREIEKRIRPKRGNHAVEGAEAVAPILYEQINNDLWAVVGLRSIMCHHTPDAHQSGRFEMADHGLTGIEMALAVCQLDVDPSDVRMTFRRQSSTTQDAVKDTEPHFKRHQYLPALLYLLFVRILRLADQRSGYSLYRYEDELGKEVADFG